MKHLTVEQRAQIVGMSLAGSSNKSIARAFAIDMKTVARWINRYHHQQNFQRLPASGRKPKIDKRMARSFLFYKKHKIFGGGVFLVRDCKWEVTDS